MPSTNPEPCCDGAWESAVRQAAELRYPVLNFLTAQVMSLLATTAVSYRTCGDVPLFQR